MKITPLDVRQQQFEKELRGLNRKEVENFLDLVASEMEQTIRQSNDLKDELRRQETRLLEFQEREQVLKETLMTAQKMTNDIKSNAERESEMIISRAEIQAEKIISLANQRLAKLIDDINELKRQRARLQSDIRSVVDAHKQLIDSMSEAEEQAKPEDVIRVMHQS